MDCDFSEFSYGYAAIREAESTLAAVYRSTGAPILPSLLQEEALGWDAKLSYVDYALFLQFKRAGYVSRRHPQSPTWPHVGSPHYRFTIDTNGHQHRALVELEMNLLSSGEVGEVYYVAPAFHRQSDFDASYAFGQVLGRSSIVSPIEFGIHDGIHHFITDKHGRSLVLSSPRTPERQISWEGLVGQARARAETVTQRRSNRRVDMGLLEEIMLTSAARLGRDVLRDVDAPRTRRIQRLAALLNCGLVLMTLEEDA